jgi:hypothetical protein
MPARRFLGMDRVAAMNPALLLATLLSGKSSSGTASSAPAVPDPVIDARDSGAGAATFRRAYAYGPSSTWSSPPGRRVVAVEMSFVGYDRAFDLDDIEIVDAEHARELDAAPDFGFFDAAGQFAGWHTADVGDTLHVLLMFELPDTVRKIRLRYCGDWLLAQPARIAASGPVYPDP